MNRTECEARVGTTLRGKWKLERLIAVGGMAAVYLARHKIGRDAAIKVLHPEIAADSRVRERFEQEALAVNNIGHPGVVEVLDVDSTDDGSHYLVMELLDGETLADRAERDTPKMSYVLDVVDQLLDVLVACHKRGVIHRDIKPENLFIQRDGKLKVLDFGIAQVRAGVRTVAGTMLGTVAFMPPEQLKGTDIDGRADLFAVGATMFSVIAGRRVHLVANDARLAMKMLTTPAPALASVTQDVAEGVCLVVDRALAFLPERRYPDAQTMRGDVWALQRNDRPPYARACVAADLDPHVTSLPAKQGDKPRTTGELPATDPQMPAFAEQKAELPNTDPQMPTFAKGDKELPTTKPEKPFGVDDEDVPDSEELMREALDDGDDHTNRNWHPGAKANKRKDGSAKSSSTPAPSQPDEAPMSDPPPSKPPISAPPDVDPAEVVDNKSRRVGALILVLLLIVAGAFAAWWTGLIPGRSHSDKAVPASSPTASATAAPTAAAK